MCVDDPLHRPGPFFIKRSPHAVNILIIIHRDGNIAVIMETGAECNTRRKNQENDQEFIFHD